MTKKESRRQFMRIALGAVLATASVSSLESLAQEQDELSYLDVYDSQIDRTRKYYSSIHGWVPSKNIIKAMIHVESGTTRNKNDSFRYDPMQIANKGDFALTVLTDGDEHTNVLGNFAFLKNKKHTPRKNGQWDYSESNMDTESSIKGGVGWLMHKQARYDLRTVEEDEVHHYTIKSGDTYSHLAKELGTTIQTLKKNNLDIDPRKLKIGQKINYKKSRQEWYVSGRRSEEEGIERYNAGGNPNYVEEVMRVKKQLDERD